MSWREVLGLGALSSIGLAGCSEPALPALEESSTGGAVEESSSSTSSSSSGEESSSTSTSTSTSTTTESSSSSSDERSGWEGVFDLGGLPDLPPFQCGAPPPGLCDAGNDVDPWHAIGINCPALGPEADQTSYTGAPSAIHVHTGGLGTFVPSPWLPRSGEKYVILSSGNAAEIPVAGAPVSTAHAGFDPNNNPPAPIVINPVSATEDCIDNPDLVGTGDCSNTIQAQWQQAGGSFANDWAELRIVTQVPFRVSGLSYDFAFFSSEYPVYFQTQFNDMFIAWLDSEQWTGNVSFDDQGHPISLNAGFLDYQDAVANGCTPPCIAPELTGFSMDGHAGTRWLTTNAPVEPGETITLVLAVFDLSDGVLDSAVIIDNFNWNCDGGAPITIPN